MSQSPANPNLNLSRKEAIHALWRKGILHWKLHKGQKELYDQFNLSDHPVFVVASGRQFGKTWGLAIIALETCIKTPNVIVKLVAPKAKDIRRIIAPALREILADCPDDLRPTFNSRENNYVFPNGSEIQLAGTDNGHAESIRGNKAHLCIIDEAGFCDDLDYVVNSILIPTMTRTRGKLIMSSTPSRSPDHPFMKFMEKAEEEGRLIKKTIYDNPHMSEEEISRIAETYGGKDSVDFRREYLVEKIISEEDAVVPEFSGIHGKDLQAKIIKEWPIPPFYDGYVSMDIGGKDLTAVLFAYYDFAAAKIIIQAEYVAGGKVLTDVIASNIKQIESRIWKEKPPTLRVADNNNIILLNDLAVNHQINFLPTAKDNADAALNNMRMLLRSERVIIHPDCKVLISHLNGAIWNRSRNSFARGADKGHYDMVHAIIYLCRNVSLQKNPYPPGYQYSNQHALFYNNPTLQTGKTKVEQHLESMFQVRKVGRKR